MEQTYTREIKNICTDFLNRVHIPFEIRKPDQPIFDDCCRAARQMGIVLDDKRSILQYLGTASNIAALAYGHLEHDKQVYIALYTASAIGLDETCSSDVESLKNFTHRFIMGKVHGHPIMDSYDMIVRQLPDRFESFAAEAMLQSALDFCVGLVMEYELLKKPALSRPSTQFPTFLRDLTGISRLYGILVFPDGTPLRSWMESIPSVIDFISYANDVLSFYKEELANESNNYISVKARSKGCTNLEALQMAVDQAVKAYEESVAVLEHSPDALEAFQQFCRGYVHFHIVDKRYKIAELWASSQC
ncbi:Isoprenoid synthase domain containing protein [Amanita muscaria]